MARSSIRDRGALAATMAAYRDSDIAVALTTARPHVKESLIVWVNAAFVELTGYSANEAVGQSAMLLAGAHPDTIHVCEMELVQSHPETMSFGIVATKQRPDGSWYDVEEWIRPLGGAGDDASLYLVCQRRLDLRATAAGPRAEALDTAIRPAA